MADQARTIRIPVHMVEAVSKQAGRGGRCCRTWGQEPTPGKPRGRAGHDPGEGHRGAEVRPAVTAVDTSGRAVLFAGSTACIALLGILVLGVGFLNGLAVASALTVVFTVLAAVTLLPALLGVLGMRVLQPGGARGAGWPPGLRRPMQRGAGAGRLRGQVERRPAVLAAAAAVVMLVLAIPVLSLRLGSSDQGNDPSSTTTRQAYDLLADGFGPGFNGPLLLVAQTSSPGDVTALQAGGRAADSGQRDKRDTGGCGSRRRRHSGDPRHLARGEGDLRPHQHLARRHHPGRRARHHAAGVHRRRDRDVCGLRHRGRRQAAVVDPHHVGLSFLLLVVAFRSLLTVTRVTTSGPPAAQVTDAAACRAPAAAVLGDLPASSRCPVVPGRALQHPRRAAAGLGPQRGIAVASQTRHIRRSQPSVDNADRDARRSGTYARRCRPVPSSRQTYRSAAILLVLPSALVTMGKEPPEPRSPVACAFWWSLVPGPGESGDTVSPGETSHLWQVPPGEAATL